MDKFAPLIATQEYWSGVGFWILVFGLIGDILILAIPEHRGRLEKGLAAFFTIVVIIGCAFEHIADGKISDLVTREESAAAVEIAQDKAVAQTAAKQAGDLGVTVNKLPDFVSGKIADVRSQYQGFEKAVSEEESRNSAALAQFKIDEAKFDKARDEAVASATEAVKTVERANAALEEQRNLTGKLQVQLSDLSSRALVVEESIARRVLTVGQQNELVARLKKFPVRQIQINPEWDTPEVASFTSQLDTTLTRVIGPGWAKSDLKAPSGAAGGGVTTMPKGNWGHPTGLAVEYRLGNDEGKRFAIEFVRLLKADGIVAELTFSNGHDSRYPNPNDPWHSFVMVYVGEVPQPKK